jgi:hypothetical protein
MELTVFARPEVLARFRGSCADAADDLGLRASALDDAVGSYLRSTERAYEATCRTAPPAVRAYAAAVEGLGSWVGRVGDAFEGATIIQGRRFLSIDRLAAELPVAMRLGAALPAVGALVAAEAIANGAHPRDLRALAQVFGGGSAAGEGVLAATDGPIGRTVGRYLDWGAAVGRGATESEGRWRSEGHLDLPARIGRAALDGLIATGGAYSGSAAGIALGNYACAPLGPPVQAVCAASGARAGTSVGGALAEFVSDAILGPEPAVPPPLPRHGGGGGSHRGGCSRGRRRGRRPCRLRPRAPVAVGRRVRGRAQRPAPRDAGRARPGRGAPMTGRRAYGGRPWPRRSTWDASGSGRRCSTPSHRPRRAGSPA